MQCFKTVFLMQCFKTVFLMQCFKTVFFIQAAVIPTVGSTGVARLRWRADRDTPPGCAAPPSLPATGTLTAAPTADGKRMRAMLKILQKYCTAIKMPLKLKHALDAVISANVVKRRL